MSLQDTVRKRFRAALPEADFVSLRLLEETSERICVRDDVLQPVQTGLDAGAMITVLAGGGLGYAATSDLSESGLKRAAERALSWAKESAGRMVHDFSEVRMPSPKGSWETKVAEPWESVPTSEKAALLKAVCAQAKRSDRIVFREASLWRTVADSLYLTADGGEARQVQHLLVPDVQVTANQGSESQTRTLGGHTGYSRQGGLEILSAIRFQERGETIADDALALLHAPNCPEGKMDLLLGPDQMMLQIHESIGHPIELDRILGDERNYAGTSFVTLDMFGTYQYGSELLDVTYDPTREGEFACFAFDDDGLPAQRLHVIEKGLLVRPLGGGVSQARAGVDGVATTRASSWNRPPIDRMSNLNLEPGDASFDALVSWVERGVYMRSNRSWSIDDSRNKFQFGCEWGRLIENGKLTTIVKNPNYRGISASFWRSLTGVGDESTFEMLGTPFCGKGEPNQAIRVGHASPACLFSAVDVFGGEG